MPTPTVKTNPPKLAMTAIQCDQCLGSVRRVSFVTASITAMPWTSATMACVRNVSLKLLGGPSPDADIILANDAAMPRAGAMASTAYARLHDLVSLLSRANHKNHRVNPMKAAICRKANKRGATRNEVL